MTSPPSPEGNNSWFKTVPEISFTRSEPGTTRIQWAETTPTYADPNWVVSDSTTAPEGINTLFYYSFDTANNTETIKSQEFKVDTETPSAPVLSGSAQSASQINTSWTVSTDLVSGLAGYKIYNAANDALLATQTGTTKAFTGLTPGTTYRYYVRGYDAAGNLSAQSNTVIITTPTIPDASAPSAPSLVGFIESGTIKLYWGASTDNVGVSGYDIFNPLVSSSTPSGSTTALSYTFPGAIPGPSRSYYIKAFDAASNRSSASNTLNFSGQLGGETSVGANVSVNPETNVSLTFNGVSAPGTTTVTLAPGNTPGPPSGFRFRGAVLNISTEASFTPPVRVAIRYNEDDVTGNEESLKLFHYDDNDNRWEDITLYVDTVNNIIVGETDSFSHFTLAELETPATGVNAQVLVLLALMFALGGVGLLRRSFQGHLMVS